MLIFKGIMDKLPQFKKYWNHMFQNKSMPVVGECQSKFLTFTRLCNELLSPEYETNKETSTMIGEMAVTAAKALLSETRDEKNPRRSIYQVLGEYYVGIIYTMLTMQLVCSKCQSRILLKYLLVQ